MTSQAEIQKLFVLTWHPSIPQSALPPSAFARSKPETPAVEQLQEDDVGFCVVLTLEMGIITPIPGTAL